MADRKIKLQKRILLLSFLAYTLAYTLRVNIAVAIPVLVKERAVTYTQMGWVNSLYFIFYMGGQLLNGYLGDHVNSKALVISGLLFSALCNLGVAFAPSFILLAACWSLNGLAQSMLWAPLIKTLSLWFYDFQLERVSFIMSLSTVIGYALSWGVSSILLKHVGFLSVFYIPAVLVLLFSLVMILFFQSNPDHTLFVPTQPIAQNEKAKLPVGQFLRLIHVPSLLLVALSQGMIREGISVWFPTLISESGYFPEGSPFIILVIVPFTNLCGILFVRHVSRYLKHDSLKTLLFVFMLITGLALLLNLEIQSFGLILLLMVLLLALTYGLSPILTSAIPFQYVSFQYVSLLAGLIDFSIYMGAAVSSAISGKIADHHPWNRVMLLWLIAAVVGLAVAAWRFFLDRNQQNKDLSV